MTKEVQYWDWTFLKKMAKQLKCSVDDEQVLSGDKKQALKELFKDE